MAGRFLIQKFSSQICKSRSLLSVPARAGAPAPEGSIRTLGHISHGATAHHVPSVHAGIRGSAARYFNTFQCSCAAAKTNYSAISTPSIITNHLKPARVDSSGGVKASFSSTGSTRHTISREAERAALTAEWDAKLAAWQADRKAWEAKMDMETKDFSKFITIQAWLWVFSGSCWTYATFFAGANGTSFCNGQGVCGVSKS